jgi:hypothetical protein
MPIQLRISPRLIPNIATLYNDINRIFMEFIDNSIDSAEQYFDAVSGSYTKPILITLNKTSDLVSTEDNCTGIGNLAKLVEEIGNSDKKGQFTTNGQFGYGIYSFLAACKELKVVSKIESQGAFELTINATKFDTDHPENVKFEDPAPAYFSQISGTSVTLSGFDKDKWKSIDLENIVSEVERHFEGVLRRGNIKILVVDSGSSFRRICKPFDYRAFDGTLIEKSFNTIETRRRKNSPSYLIHLTHPVSVYIKVTPDRVIGKAPIFVIKGRRIAEISSIRQFNTAHRSDIWAHPNVTGYVDVSGVMEPNIARTDFKSTRQSKAVFDLLVELEPRIQEIISEVDIENRNQQFKTLESKLTDALAKLAKWDNLNMRKDFTTGDEVYLESGASGQSFEEGLGNRDHSENGNAGTGPGIGENEGEGKGLSGEAGEDSNFGPDAGDKGMNQEPDNPFEETMHRGAERRRSGFDIQFVSGIIIDESTQKPIRSQVIDGTIRIYKEHEEFEKRLDHTRSGEPKISQRLITYLAGEITVHYKDRLQQRTGQYEYHKDLFVNLVEFIYAFEDQVKDLEGLKLSEL